MAATEETPRTEIYLKRRDESHIACLALVRALLSHQFTAVISVTFILPPPVLVLQPAGFRAITFPLSASGNQSRTSSQFSGIRKDGRSSKVCATNSLLLHLCNRAIVDYLQLKTRRRRKMRTQTLHTHCMQSSCDLISVEKAQKHNSFPLSCTSETGAHPDLNSA